MGCGVGLPDSQITLVECARDPVGVGAVFYHNHLGRVGIGCVPLGTRICQSLGVISESIQAAMCVYCLCFFCCCKCCNNIPTIFNHV